MAKKYDTNPLDLEILQRAEAARQSGVQAEINQSSDHPTELFEVDARPFAALSIDEMPTKKFSDADLNKPYESIFERVKPFAPMSNSVSSSMAAEKAVVIPPTNRKVLGLGLPENMAMILPYLPLQIGAIAAVIELLFVSRTETRVRFHAAQALALHIASWVITVVLGFVGEFVFFGTAGVKIFQAIVLCYFVVSIIRVWRGKANHIEALDDVTDFLNEKIQPRK